MLISIANHVSGEGTAYAGAATYAKESRLSERGVRYALRELEALGEIAREGTHPSLGTWVWRMTMTSGASSPAAVEGTPAAGELEAAQRNAVADATSEGQTVPGQDLPGGANVGHLGEEQIAPKPTTNIRSKNKRRDAPRVPDAIWDELTELYGPPLPRPHPDHGRRNRAVQNAKLAGATAEELGALYRFAVASANESVRARAQTPSALATNIGDLRRLRGAASAPSDPSTIIGTAEHADRIEREELEAMRRAQADDA